MLSRPCPAQASGEQHVVTKFLADRQYAGVGIGDSFVAYDIGIETPLLRMISALRGLCQARSRQLTSGVLVESGLTTRVDWWLGSFEARAVWAGLIRSPRRYEQRRLVALGESSLSCSIFLLIVIRSCSWTCTLPR